MAEHSLSRIALSSYCPVHVNNFIMGGMKVINFQKMPPQAEKDAQKFSVEICSVFLPLTYHVTSARSSVSSMRINPLTPETFLRFRVSFFIQTIQWIGLRDSVYGVTMESGAVPKHSMLELKGLELKFTLGSEFSEFFDKIPVRILFDVLFCVFRFSKASSNALTTSFLKF